MAGNYVGAMVMTARAIQHPDTVINSNGSIFHCANSLGVTIIPFCLKMVLHSNPTISPNWTTGN